MLSSSTGVVVGWAANKLLNELEESGVCWDDETLLFNGYLFLRRLWWWFGVDLAFAL